ncbi:MAG: hypothetical protein VYA30_09865 [Myxococcota bacterium]|nr:hypothetical protein [Myxococcota bacterium]
MSFIWLFVGLSLAQACPDIVLKSKIYKQSGPTCMVSAAITALGARTEPPRLSDIARNIPIWKDGVHAYDLLVELERRGWRGLVFTGPPEAAARLVEVGFAVIAVIQGTRGRHAVTVTGRRRTRDSFGACTRSLEALQIVDSSSGRKHWMTAKAFAKVQSNQQLLVFFMPSERRILKASRFPLDIAERVDRRFRAQELYLRAKKHKRPNRQMLTLLHRAVRADPCHPRARAMYHRIAHELDKRHDPIPACQSGDP